MITEQDVDRIKENVRGDEKNWWVKLARSHKGEGEQATEGLKKTILDDFMAWSILGSFMASIAFAAVMNEVSFPPLPHFVFTVTDVFMWLATACGFDTTKDISEWFLRMFSKLIFMWAATNATRGVILGTLKYLYFVSIPPHLIVKAICKYHEHGMASRRNREAPRTWHFWELNQHFTRSYWDHMSPILTSVIWVAYGAAFVSTLSLGILISLPIWYMCIHFRYIVQQKAVPQCFKVANEVLDIEEPPAQPPSQRPTQHHSRSPPRRQHRNQRLVKDD